jgi:hypothetical protein
MAAPVIGRYAATGAAVGEKNIRILSLLPPANDISQEKGGREASRNSLRQNLGVALRMVYGSGSDIGEAALRHKQVEADTRRGDFRASIELRKAAED